MRIYIYQILILLIIISCDSEENSPIIDLNPEVTTLNALIGNTGGVSLYGDFIAKKNKIAKIGFEYGLDSLHTRNIVIVDSNEVNADNEFSYFISQGIWDKSKYYYKAFVQSDTNKFYGEIKSFISDGRIAPEIISISSDYGHISDTIEIYGKYFRDKRCQTYIRFSNVRTNIITINDSLIRCTVPTNIKNVETDIHVCVDNKEDIYKCFNLYSPIINSVEPIEAFCEDTITIKGDHFDILSSRNKVSFGDVEAKIVYADRNTIRVVVPENLENYSEQIKVSAQIQDVAYETNFKLYTPEIHKITPIKTVLGDEITIIGNNFDLTISKNKVYFGNTEAKITYADRNTLKVIVPYNMKNTSEQIKVKAQLQEVVYENKFELLSPEISNISSLKGTFRDEITITGNNFDKEISRNKVYFGNIEAKITYADPNTLKVIVPDDIESSTEKIKVEAQLQEKVFAENFKLNLPIISFIPQDISAGQEIDIQGSNFHPVSYKNIVKFEEITLPIYYGTTTTNISSIVPNGPYPRRKVKVKIQVLDMVTEYSIELNIKDRWIMVSNNMPFSYYRSVRGAVIVNNEAYIIAPPKGWTEEKRYLWKFNPSDFSWEKSDIPFTIDPYGVLTSNGNKIYLYTANDNNEFLEYDPLSKKWTKRSSFPGSRRDMSAHFSINGEIYIGIGANIRPISVVPYQDFHKYSPDTDTWTQISSYNNENYHRRTEAACFVVNNKAYLGNGASDTGMYDFWTYDPKTDKWTQIADFQDARSYTASFVMNGYGYVCCGSAVGSFTDGLCWKYDHISNVWVRIDNSGLKGRYGHFSFSVNGKAYIGGGSGQSGLYEFIP